MHIACVLDVFLNFCVVMPDGYSLNPNI